MQQLKFGQVSGKLWADGVLIGFAYSGNGAGLNNPSLQNMRNVGVIPAGKYQGGIIDRPQLGPRVWALTPMPGTEMFGRNAFCVHWDTPAKDFAGSDGCIVPLDMETVSPRIQDNFELEVAPD